MDEIRILLMDVGIPAYFADIGFWVTLLGVIWAINSIGKLTESNQDILRQLVKLEERDDAIFHRLDALETTTQTLNTELMHIQLLNNLPIKRGITIPNDGGESLG